jgi:hypothetical protein
MTRPSWWPAGVTTSLYARSTVSVLVNSKI